jgi:hypothetical protein
MKGCRRYRFGFVLLMIVIWMYTGCTYVLKTDDIPTLQMGSPLKSVGQKTFAFKEFKDIRDVKSPFLIKEVEFGSWVSDKPVSSLFMLALKKEWERNGHICVEYSKQVKADYIIEGIVYKCSVTIIPGFIAPTQTAYTGVKLTVSHVSDREEPLLIKSYEGEYRFYGTGVTWKEVLTNSLLSMIKEISVDSELIEFIKK